MSGTRELRELETAGPAPRRAAQRTDAGATDQSRSIADPPTADPASMLELQRLAGNATVSRLVAPGPGVEDEPMAQRSPVVDVVGGAGGQPLDDGLRSEMESRLGSDFGDVRVHADAAATESAEAVGANAYTVGDDVVFRSDHWSPSTDDGKKTLAHELTHVVQQRSGPVDGTDAGGGIRISDPDDRFERAADQVAEAAMAGGPASTPAPAAAAPPTAQRQVPEEEEEEALQGSFVQRQVPEEEEEEALQGSFVQRQEEPEEEEMPM